MALVRGSNPIWYEVDLTAHAFDDTFYLFILENEIPYMPATVWHDPFGNIPWSNPIQFLANGTLPNNVFFDPDATYRLEFRQNDNVNPPSQSDPLVYLVEDYSPGPGGNSPVDDVSFSTDNQVSNPQFALINFTSPLVLPGITTQSINIAPGWFLDLTGSGSATITQVLLNSSVDDPTNAAYAIQIQLSGSWTNSVLRQRFERNGILWANTFVSSSITALTAAAPQIISATLVDSQGATLATVLEETPLTETFNEYVSVAELLASTNTDFPPSAFIEYQLLLPNSCNITLSSVQLISGDIQLTYPYQQTTYERQVDQTYHNAYPIMPVGAIIDYTGFSAPDHYLLCDGTAYSRIEKSQLFNTITTTESVTLSNGVATFTVASGGKYRVGMGLEGTGIATYATIIGITGNTITMSSNASTSGSSTVRFFAAAPAYSETVTLTNTIATFTVASATNYHIGMAVRGLGIPAATVISNIVGTTITISNAATATGPAVVTFYAVGNGDGSTTFNVFDCRDYVFAGAGGAGIGSVANSGAGGSVGYPTHTLTAAEMTAHTHASGVSGFIVSTPGVGSIATAAGTDLSVRTNTAASTGTSTPFPIVQPTMFMNKYIRFE